MRDGGWDRESKVKLGKMVIRKESTLDMIEAQEPEKKNK